MNTIVYPGAFDPVTLGHLDVIERAAAMFDQVIVGIGDNPEKRCLFSAQERLAMMREETARFKNVSIHTFEGLMVDFARAHGVKLILRGIRTVSDLEYEMQMAFANRQSGGVETLFIAPRQEYAFINSRFVKEIAARGGEVTGMVSEPVATRLRERRK